jgi:hypothetical protein
LERRRDRIDCLRDARDFPGDRFGNFLVGQVHEAKQVCRGQDVQVGGGGMALLGQWYVGHCGAYTQKERPHARALSLHLLEKRNFMR